MSVRTRFAPSPTGYLHIGGARTALFNWLLARRHGGQFILRIDDTDEARHVDEAVSKILEGFRWLGIDWDEGPEIGGPHGPYYQSQRGDKYEAAIIQLIKSGKAYPDLTPTTEVDTLRRAAEAAKQPFVYRGKERDMDPAAALDVYLSKRPAVRYKVPSGRVVALDDKVRGHVEWQTDLLGDFTIARNEGKPLYNLATVVDDIDMKITHIVRAEEHLSNTHPQLHLFEGLGGEKPVFAHIPYVAAPGTKKKLSKRNPPPGVMVALEEYEQAGYLPRAVLNGLARLGWSLDDKTEVMDLQTVIDNFSLEKVVAAPAGLDPDKLYWLQDQYMKQLPSAERVDRMIPFLAAKGLISAPPTAEERETVAKIDAASGDRLKLLSDIVRYGEFFFTPTIDHDKEAAKHLRKEGAAEVVEKIKDALATLEQFDVKSVEGSISQLGASTGLGGKINHILRAATTGRSVGPGVYDCVAILGREKTLRNLEHTLAAIREGRIV